MNTYQATATREGGWWIVNVPGIGAAQGHTTAEARRMAIDLVSVMLDVSGDEVTVDIDFQPPGALADDVRESANLSSDDEKVLHVCFVCSGNICRSPTAAVVFTEHLRRAGLAEAVRVSSAGIGPWHVGESIDARAGAVLTRHGYPIDHTAAQVDSDHLDADLLLAMDSGHQQALRRIVADPDRVRMFRSFDPDADPDGTGDLDVPDPYYGGPNGFEDVLAMIEAATPGLLAWVRSNRE